MKRFLTSIIAVAYVSLGLSLIAAEGDLANKNKPPVQVFYNPLPENDVLTALVKLQGDYEDSWKPVNPMYSYTYISIFCDNTVIYYDQWENGYEIDLANPNDVYSASNPMGTQIWGDGDLSNGCAPGTTDDILNAGTIIKLISEVDINKRGKVAYFDASDKWGSSKPVAASRTVWASQSKTLLAGANEMYDTSYFGTEFVAPCGTDTPNQLEVFQYTGFSIMAGEGGATVQYSLDGRTVAGTRKLKEGEAFLVNGNVKQGGWVKTTAGKVQVELITGDIYDNFESRFIKILPRSMWNTSYTCPIATPTSVKNGTTTYTCGTKIWIYNPDDTALSVTYKYRTSTTIKSATISIPAKSAKAIVPASGTSTSTTTYTGAMSATYLSANRPFYALATVDCLGTKATATQKSSGDNRTWDWGCALIPDASLSTQILVGLGLGCDPNTTKPEDAAPIWVSTPSINGDSSFNASTTVYVKYDASTGTAPYTDPNGNAYDKKFTLHPLEMYKLYNDSAKSGSADQKKNGQTGMTFWTLDGTKLAAAWGEDPLVATASDPGIDMGTGIPPMPELFMQKRSKLIDDKDKDGYVSCGDVLEYTVDMFNIGRVPITDVRFGDNLSEFTSYVRGNNIWFYKNDDVEHKVQLTDGIWDQIANGGYMINAADLGLTGDLVLGIGETWTLCYYIQVGDEPCDAISNRAWANNQKTSLVDSVTDYLRAKVGDYVWLDADGDGIQDADEIGIKGAKVSLITEDGDVMVDDFGHPYTQITGDDGHYLFIGVRPGTYTVKVEVPEVYAATVKDAGSNDAVDSDIDPVTFTTDPFVVHGGYSYLDVDSGLVVKQPPASIKIVKTPSATTIPLGTSVTYTYKVTNTGYTHLHDVVVTDDKLGTIGTITGILAPGESATLTATTALDVDTTNIGTVTGIPGDKDGNDLAGVPTDPVTDSDDATVNVVDISAWIGDYVWLDIDGDGIQDADEPGLEGVEVTLTLRTTTTTTSKWGKKTTTTTDTTIATTTTDANGAYIFKGLDATKNTDSVVTEYFVTFTNPNSSLWSYAPANAGSDDAVDSDALANGKTGAITLDAGEHELTIDCGLVFNGNASIEIVKTADQNEVDVGTEVTYTYAVKNTGDTYLANVIVTDDKIPGQSKVIDLLAPGETKSVTMSAVISADTTNVATATGTPSDPNGNPWSKDTVSDTDDETVTVKIYPATIGDYVWVDVNKDGIQNDGFPLKDVTVQLIASDGNVAQTTVTDGNGFYSFTVPADKLGTYRVKFIAPEGFGYTTKGTGTANDSDANKTGVTDSIVLASGTERTDIDCGLVFNGTASISIVKTAGDAADGDVLKIERDSQVTYKYLVTNTGSVALRDVTVTDDKLGNVGTVQGILLPGASAVLYKTSASIPEGVTNIGTVIGTPCDNNGKAYTTETVTDNDDAVVEVYDLGSIGGIVWIDADKDGIQDEGEVVKTGVPVKLLDSNGTVVGTTTTDSNGAYLFDNLVPGDYSVVVTKPTDFDFTQKDVGNNDNIDSDVAKATGKTDTVVLPSGEDVRHVDAGLVSTTEPAIEIIKLAGDAPDGETYSVLKGTAFNYTITIRNSGTSYLKDIEVKDATLDKTWNVDFLAPGATKTFTVPSTATDDITNVATVEGTPCDSEGNKTDSENVTDNDDAVVDVYELGSISGLVWIDADKDGIQDDGEATKPGVPVVLLDDEGNKVAETVTDNDGGYKFDDLEPGDYRVVVDPPADYAFTDKDQGADDTVDSDVTKTNGKTDLVTVESGKETKHVDAGLVSTATASIEIIKLAGNAADGDVYRVVKGTDFNYTITIKNTGATYLKDVKVNDETLSWNADGITLAPGESKTFTIASAATADVTNVADVEGTPADEDGNTIDTTKVTDDDDAVVDVYELGSIGDFVWIDVDGDGIQDDGEQGIEGAKVLLYAEGSDEPAAFTFTDENGFYKFDNLEPGNYRVEFVNPQIDIYAFTAKDAGDDAVDSDADASGKTAFFALAEGEEKTDVDAGLVLKDGTAAIDLVKVAGDAPDGATLIVTNSADVTYTLTIKNTGKVALANVIVTDETYNKTFEIGFLAVGAEMTRTFTANVAEDIVNVANVEGIPADDDGTPISDDPVTDTDDAKVIVTIPTCTIGDYVWNDSDGDGIQDENEVGIYNITVELRDAATSNLVATTKTDAKGGYHFDDVVAGDYVIHFVPGSTWDFTEQFAGDDTAVDSNANSEGWTPVFTVEPGKDDLTLDAGLVGGVPPGICDLIEVAYYYNGFVLGNLKTLGGDSEGNLLVGGNADLASGYSVGQIGPGYGRTRDAADADTDALVVGGNLSEKTYAGINGNIVYGGEYSNPSAYNGRLYGMRHVDPVTLDDNWNVPEDHSGRSIQSVADDVTQFSEIVGELGQRGNPVYDGKIWTAFDTFRNIFIVDDPDWVIDSLHDVTVVDLPVGSKVVVNVYSDTFTARNGSVSFYNTDGELVDPSLILFNFVNATNIVTSSFDFQGSVLAPKAVNADLAGGAVNGFGFFGGDVVTSRGFEFHDFMFKAFDCSKSDVITQRPQLDVVVTAGDAKDGAILDVAVGTEVEVKAVIKNAGNFAFRDLQVSVFGIDRTIDSLDVGEELVYTTTFVAGEEGTTTFNASAYGYGVGTVPFAEILIGDSDSAQIDVAASAEVLAAVKAAKAPAAVKWSYIPRPDFEIDNVQYVGGVKPSQTGEVFSVYVTIKNSGEIAAKPGRVAVGFWAVDPDGQVSFVKSGYADVMASIEAGAVSAPVLVTAVAPLDAGYTTLRVEVDAAKEVEELSEGNNHWLDSVRLSKFLLNVNATAEGILLEWDSYNGEGYVIYGSSDLKNFEVLQVEGKDYVEATPPRNSVLIETGATDARFFKLYADSISVLNPPQ